MTTAEAIALASRVRSRQPLSKVRSALAKRIATSTASLAKSFDGMATHLTVVDGQIATALARLARAEEHFPQGTEQ